MGVPREDLLLMTRALKRGCADLKAVRRALDRQVSKPISFLEALHLAPAELEALRADTTAPDPVADRPLLDGLQKVLVDGEDLTSAEWEKFVASLARPTARHGWAPLPVPQEFDGYTLQWELARRERGVVYRAKDKDGRDVAIKVFRKDVPVEGLARVEGLSYAVSPFVDGESLEAKHPSARRGAHAIWKAAEALRERAHGALSPSRILVRRDDSVAVLGLETAKSMPMSSRSRAYAGPSDAHALGAILYEILVGAPPAGETSPRARSKDIDEGLDRIVSCALSGGYATTAALADDLGRYFKGEPITGRKAPGAVAAGSPKSWIWIAAAAVPIVALIVWLCIPKTKPGAPAVPEVDPPFVKADPPSTPPPPVKPRETVRTPIKPAPPAKPLTADEEQQLYDRCVEAQANGDNDKVLEVANEAIARGTKRDWPYYHLANQFLIRKELDKALEYVLRALEISPNNADFLELRAHTFVFRGETRKALADFESLYGKKNSEVTKQITQLGKQAEADPKDARPRFLRGVLYLLKRHHETAATDFTAAIEGGYPRALAWRAAAFKGAEDPARAAADAKAYLAEYPNDFATEEVKALLKDLSKP